MWRDCFVWSLHDQACGDGNSHKGLYSQSLLFLEEWPTAALGEPYQNQRKIYQLHSCKMKSIERSAANWWIAVVSYSFQELLPNCPASCGAGRLCKPLVSEGFPAGGASVNTPGCPWGSPGLASLGPLHKCCWRLAKDRVSMKLARTSILKNLTQIFDAVHLWVLSALFNQEV